MNFSDIFKTVPGWIPESEFTDIFKRVTKDATVSGVHVATALGNESTTNSKKPKKPKDVRAELDAEMEGADAEKAIHANINIDAKQIADAVKAHIQPAAPCSVSPPITVNVTVDGRPAHKKTITTARDSKGNLIANVTEVDDG